MALNTNPIFPKSPDIGQVTISTANANRDGTGTIGTVYTAGADGAYIETVVVKATGNTTAGIVRLYIYDGVSVYTLIYEMAVDAITPSGTVLSYFREYYIGKRLEAGYSLRASTVNAESFVITAFAGSLTA